MDDLKAPLAGHKPQHKAKNKAQKGALPVKRGNGLLIAIIGLAVVTVVLVVLAVLIQPIMTPQGQIEVTAIAITKTAAHKTGDYIDPDLLIEPLPVENVSGIAILGGLMALIVLGVVLREYVLWRRKGSGDDIPDGNKTG
ncbi:MAG: hypothetical protein GX853_06935 [Chloroflexi bacterium]|jgi:hypothetical protein|nr:hypothetical protein [Chloroflexota bacterium]